MKLDLAIVGAGIVGCACALAAARAGLRVQVIDSGRIGAGATAAGMGHLVLIDEDPAECALARRGLELWQAYREQTALQWQGCGTLWLAQSAAQVDAAQAKLQRMRAADWDCEWLDATALRAAEPQLGHQLLGALRVSGDATVYAPAMAALLAQQARELGVHFLERTTVDQLLPGALRRDGRTLVEADRVVLAAGAASRALLPQLPLRARKGHLLISDRHPGFVHHALVELGYIDSAHGDAAESVAFNLQPRPTGQLLLGSTRQMDVTDSQVEPRMLAALVQRASAFVPNLGRLSAIRAWAGSRAAPHDGRPYIGRWPGPAELWLCTGHEGLGITTALSSAELLVDGLLKRAGALDGSAFDPARCAA